VTYHGSYIPLQGLEVIVRAFALLKNEQTISFRMVGDGQEFAKTQALIGELGLQERIEVIRRVPFAEIPAYLAATDIVLGIFGTTDKARRVVPNKVYEGLAAGRAVISMDTPALREMFSEQEVYRIQGSPEALALAIRTLVRDHDLRARYAKQGYEALLERYSPRPIGHMLVAAVKKVVKS
jgi:glycosyltransferase involved in cell wall biosynthesis